MDHYSGFVFPSKWFVDNDIRGSVVPNGWIVSNIKPWYLTERLPQNRKLSSEAFLFESRILVEVPSHPKSCEVISQKDQRNLKVIYSLLNVCQLAYSNVSINVLKELLVHTKDEVKRSELNAALSGHVQHRDEMNNLDSDLKELVSYLPQRKMVGDILYSI